MKKGIAKIPLVGAACRAAGFIFVDNSTPRAAQRSIAESEQQLKKGDSLVVFPEGSRSPDGKMHRFLKGAFRVALDLNLPIVPITLNGPYYVMPIGSKIIRPHRMEMVIHPPISVDNLSCNDRESLLKLVEDVKNIIASALWEEFQM